MAEFSKELLKEDIIAVARFSTQTDYHNIDEVKALYERLAEGTAFHTVMGTRYLERLARLMQGEEAAHTCVLCGRDSGDNPVICTDCLSYIPTETQAEKKDEDAPGKVEAWEAKAQEADLLFCQNCGSELEKGAKICSECGMDPTENHNFCGCCGAKIPERKASQTKAAQADSVQETVVQQDELTAALEQAESGLDEQDTADLSGEAVQEQKTELAQEPEAVPVQEQKAETAQEQKAGTAQEAEAAPTKKRSPIQELTPGQRAEQAQKVAQVRKELQAQKASAEAKQQETAKQPLSVRDLFMEMKESIQADQESAVERIKRCAVLAAIFAVFLLAAQGASGSGQEQAGMAQNAMEAEAVPGQAGSEADALLLVQEFYPVTDYEITPKGAAEMSGAVFTCEVGDKVSKEAWIQEKQTGVNVFDVISRESARAGQVWVSEDGRMIQLGLDGDGGFYRIR